MTGVDVLASVGQFGLSAGISVYLVYWATNIVNRQLLAHEEVMVRLCDKLNDHDRRAERVEDDVNDIKTHLFGSGVGGRG